MHGNRMTKAPDFVHRKPSSLITGFLCSVNQNWWGVFKLASEQHQMVLCTPLAKFEKRKMKLTQKIDRKDLM